MCWINIKFSNKAILKIFYLQIQVYLYVADIEKTIKYTTTTKTKNTHVRQKQNKNGHLNTVRNQPKKLRNFFLERLCNEGVVLFFLD